LLDEHGDALLVAKFELAPGVLDDLDRLSEIGTSLFGEAQVDRYVAELFGRFQLLAEFPGIGGPKFTIRRRKVRRFPFGSHVIIYADIKNGVRILRVMHCRTDWRRELRRTGI
jgi:toxin ParE1/3/4